MPDLIEELHRDARGFDFFQALHLLERAQPDRMPVGTGVGLDEAAGLSALVSLAFQPSDVSEVRAAEAGQAPSVLVTPVMSLAGAQGPLPLVFTEMLLQQARRRDRSGLSFLDIFNQRFLAFLYRGRAKHRLALHSGAVFDAPVVRLIDALSGSILRRSASSSGGATAWLRHAALQGGAPRSIATLQALVRDAVGLRTTGRSFVGRWIDLREEDQAVLAGRSRAGCPGTRLGVNGTLGRRVWDQSAGIELRTEPLSRSDLEELLPGRPAHGVVHQLVRRHFQGEFQVRLVTSLAPGESRRCELSSMRGGQLGLTTWIGATETPDADGLSRPPNPAAPRFREAAFLLRA